MPFLPRPTARSWQPRPAPRKPYQAHAERSPLYDSPAWRKLRLHQLRQEPCCRACAASDRVTPATVADHIEPVRDGADFFDGANLQSLCLRCHAKKSAKESHGRTYSTRKALE